MRRTGKISRAQYEAMSHAERVNYQKSRLKRKKRQRDRLVFGIVMIFICAVGVTLSFTVFFKIAEVEVVGNLRYSSEQIVEKSEIELESNMLLVNKRKIAALLEQELPYIGQALIKRSLPDKIIIEVEESSVAFAVREPKGYVLLDENCKVLEKEVKSYPENVALLVGIDTKEFSTGAYLLDLEDEELSEKGEVVAADVSAEDGVSESSSQKNNAVVLRSLIKVAEALKEADFEDITKLDFSDVNNIKLLYQDRLTLIIGTSSNLEQKLRLAKKTIADEDEIRPFRTGIVDVTRGNKVYVRGEEYTTKNLQEETETETRDALN